MSGGTSVVLVPGRTPETIRNSSDPGRTRKTEAQTEQTAHTLQQDVPDKNGWSLWQRCHRDQITLDAATSGLNCGNVHCCGLLWVFRATGGYNSAILNLETPSRLPINLKKYASVLVVSS